MKKRGRPPKARFDLPTDIPAAIAQLESRIEAVKADQDAQLLAKAQDHASRVWAGHSPDLDREQRLTYVKAALDEQGLSMDGVVL